MDLYKAKENFYTYDMREMDKVLPEVFIEENKEDLDEIKIKVERVLKEYLQIKIEVIKEYLERMKWGNFPIPNFDLSNMEIPVLFIIYYHYFPRIYFEKDYIFEEELILNTENLVYYILNVISALFGAEINVSWKKENDIKYRFNPRITGKLFKGTYGQNIIWGITLHTYKEESTIETFCRLWNYFQNNLSLNDNLEEQEETSEVYTKFRKNV